MLHALIAAPTPMLRAGLRSLLATTELAIVGDTSTLAAPGPALWAVDVIVVADAALLADTGGLVSEESRPAMVVLSDDEQTVGVLRRLPLRGWAQLPAEAGAAEIGAAAAAAAQGLVVVAPALAERLLNPRAATETLEEPLTAREREVLDLVGQGLSNKLIARQLRISEHTVKFHVSAIYAKLGAVSRTDAVNRGARYGLITL